MSRRVSLKAALLAPLLAALGVAAVVAGPGTHVAPASAQAQNRVAVIVHTGGGSAAVCVRFDEPAISGLEALQRAGLGAVVRGFSGQGGAVCGINGVGCSADDSCLTCQAPNYWAYHRAGPGAGGFSYASAGAGSSQVTDGSVEGWQWGTGAPPPFQTVDQVCGAATPPPAPAPSPAPATGGAAGAEPGGSSSGGGGRATPGAEAEAPATIAESVATTTTAALATTVPSAAEADEDDSADGGPRRTVDGELAAASSSGDGGGNSAPAVVLFVLLASGVAVAAVVIRRRHAR